MREKSEERELILFKRGAFELEKSILKSPIKTHFEMKLGPKGEKMLINSSIEEEEVGGL